MSPGQFSRPLDGRVATHGEHVVAGRDGGALRAGGQDLAALRCPLLDRERVGEGDGAGGTGQAGRPASPARKPR